MPVLLTGVIQAAAPALAEKASPLIVDCTVGGGGHAAALLERFPSARLVGIDRDPNVCMSNAMNAVRTTSLLTRRASQAVAAASQRLAPFGLRARVVHGTFADVGRTLAGERALLSPRAGPNPSAKAATPACAGADFLLADIGVSSHQLDERGRGFAFSADGPLDMRMDQVRDCGVVVAACSSVTRGRSRADRRHTLRCDARQHAARSRTRQGTSPLVPTTALLASPEPCHHSCSSTSAARRAPLRPQPQWFESESGRRSPTPAPSTRGCFAATGGSFRAPS